MEETLQCFERAAGACEVQVHDYRIADRILRIRHAGSRLSDEISLPLSHLEIPLDEEASIDLEISVMDVHMGGKEVISRPWIIEDRPANLRLPTRSQEGQEVRYELMEEGICLFHQKTGRGLVVIEEAERLPLHLRASPFRLLLHWWARELGLQILHAGAVAIDGEAVLLIGRGGSGKSTLAAAAYARGFDYLGDDYVLMSDEPRFEVHSLYRSGKLTFPGLDLLGITAMQVVNRDRDEDEKALLIYDDRVVRRATPRALVFPRVVQGPPEEPRRLRSGETLRALAPSTLLQLTGSGPEDLARLAGLVRKIPGYQLEIGSDLSLATDQLRSLLVGGEEDPCPSRSSA